MATWKITVKDTITYNGVHLEKGMFVEYVTPTLDHALQKTTNHDAVNQLFKSKYGVDLKKIGFINVTRLDFEKKQPMLTYISNTDHYKEVLSRVQSVKHMLWIGTADIKDLYVEVGKEKKPFLALIAHLIRRGVEVRLIHAKEPGPNFREDFDKYPVLYDRLERVLCPRVHFKMLVFDGKEVYVGSANLTGAGIGMKTDFKRNFEAGILTDDPDIVEQAMNQFDEVWMGKFCKTCKRRDFCLDPIAQFFRE